jgi:hypothetical protein
MHEHAELTDSILHAFLHAAGISLFVFLMMVVVDYLNVLTEGRLTTRLKGGRSRQYLLSSFLGVLPGCLGSFLTVTFYIRGMLGFGAVVGCFVASSGDAAFVMLAKIPETALLLFGILFVLGIFYGWLSDRVADRLGIVPCAECSEAAHHLGEPDCRTWPEKGVIAQLIRIHPLRVLYLLAMAGSTLAVVLGWVGPGDWNWIRVAILFLLAVGAFVMVTVPDHYLIEHVGHHITRHHLPRIFAWTLGTLLILTVSEHFFDLHAIVSGHMVWVLAAAALIGIVPDSGPHLLFVFLYANGTVPFSVLLTSSIVQDGHGMLPLLSISIKDSLQIKAFNLVLGLSVGLIVLALGY